jgi:predicted amidohydrolase
MKSWGLYYKETIAAVLLLFIVGGTGASKQNYSMMADLKLATVQFENASGDKEHNLSIIRRLSAEAASRGCQVIAFHECSVTGYTVASRLSRDELLSVAEQVPGGPSIKTLIHIALNNNIIVLAGLFERDFANSIYNTYVCVDGKGVLARYRKLHPFISSYLAPGNE